MSKKILVIGSGIAGISSSLKLKSYGINSIIVDKGNFIGGRIGTREIRNSSSSSFFFHGAQFFTAKTNEFKKIISTGVNGKYIKEFILSNISISGSSSIQLRFEIFKLLPLLPKTPNGYFGLFNVKKISATSRLEIISSFENSRPKEESWSLFFDES